MSRRLFLLSRRRARRDPRRISTRESRFGSNPSIDRRQIGLGSIIELGSKSSRAREDWVCPRSTPRCSGVFCGNNDWFNPIGVHSHRRPEFFSTPFGLRRLNLAKALRKLWERIAEALTPSPVGGVFAGVKNQKKSSRAPFEGRDGFSSSLRNTTVGEAAVS